MIDHSLHVLCRRGHAADGNIPQPTARSPWPILASPEVTIPLLPVLYVRGSLGRSYLLYRALGDLRVRPATASQGDFPLQQLINYLPLEKGASRHKILAQRKRDILRAAFTG